MQEINRNDITMILLLLIIKICRFIQDIINTNRLDSFGAFYGVPPGKKAYVNF